MKKIALIYLCFLLRVSHCFAQNLPNQIFTRLKINFNRDWRFKLGNIEKAEDADFDDSRWDKIGLPHSFSIPYFMSADFYVGYGWYRKQFVIPPAFQKKRWYLEFEGAFQDAKIYINGHLADEHIGGYTGFSVDVSAYLKKGENTLAVSVNNIWNPRLAPRAGEHVFSGGIYRDVYLVATDPIHVAWNGTCVTTSQASGTAALVNVETEIINNSGRKALVKLQTDIVSPERQLVASMTSNQVVNSGALFKFKQNSREILHPRLWDLEHPFLYTSVTRVWVGGKLKDEYKTRFGVRTIKWTADKGFFLNGRHVYLLGVNAHQDHAGWGDAVTNTGFYRDVKLIKDAGFNFIRGSHYCHDPAFVAACDSLGVLLWSENGVWGIGGSLNVPDGYWNTGAYPGKPGDRAAFGQSVKQQLREMIRMHRNSPSVIAWSMCNEPFFIADSLLKPMRVLLKDLVNYSHQLDPSRPAALGGVQRPIDSTRIDKIGDIAGHNGDGATIAVFQNPGIPSVVSEYGSTTADRPGKYEPGWSSLSAEEGKPVYPWRSGQAIWCAFDHGSIAGSQLGKMGIIDYFRIPKRAYYWYRNEYAHVPPPEWPRNGKPAALKLEVDKPTASTDGTDDVRLLITVLDSEGKAISNSPKVMLSVVSGPGEFPTGSSILFDEKSDISILDGQAAIEFRSWFAGKSIIRATSPGLMPAEVKIEFTGKYPFVTRQKLQAPERPYIRFKKAGVADLIQLFGPNNPTFASSFTEGHTSGHAADDKANTWWQAAIDDSSPSWILDSEKHLSMKELNIKFPTEDIYQFSVEVSDDMKGWKTAVDFTENTQRINSKHFDLRGIKGRSIQIRFKAARFARLAEVVVAGNIVD